MMSIKIPTAEEILSKQGVIKSPISGLETYLPSNAKNAMVEFAKIHVEAALKAASEKADGNIIDTTNDSRGFVVIDEQSILQSYLLTNIK